MPPTPKPWGWREGRVLGVAQQREVDFDRRQCERHSCGVTGTAPRDLDELLAHADWVQRLSLQLCRDQHAAADAAQEAWLQTLRRRPDARGSARGFLATVLGNVVRMRGRADQRVQRRERAAARSCDLTESAADACARAELQQFVVREVLALPEPQKALVLLHYFEGHAVADLAKRHRITADAVRAHLRRARDTLRQRLQSQDGPARRAFGALLLSHSSSLPWLLVSATMAIGIKTKLLAAAAVLALASWALWPSEVPTAKSDLATGDATSARDATASVANASPPADGGVQRVAVDARQAAVQPVVRCQLVGLHGNAAWTTPFEVRFPGAGPAPDPVFAQPDAHGAFTIAAPSGGDQFAARLVADDPNYANVDIAASFVLSRHAEQPYEIPVQPVARVVGTVVDFEGTPVQKGRVSAFAWIDGKPRAPHSDATTGSEGEFQIKVPMESELFLVAIAMREMEARERRIAQGTVPTTTTARDDLLPATVRVQARFGAVSVAPTLTLAKPTMITGELRDPQGRPVPGERVYWSPSDADLDLEIDAFTVNLGGKSWDELIVAPWATTDERGAFRLAARAGMKGTLYLAQGPSCIEPFTDMRTVTAPAHVPFQLGGNTVVLRVVRAGEPVPGAYMLWEKFAGGDRPRTDERGELRLLRERAQVQKLTMKSGGEGVDLELPLDTAPDRSIVVELGALARAFVTFDVTSTVAVKEFAALFRAAAAKSSDGLTVSRDAEGRYRCEVVPGDYQISVCASNRAEGDDRFLCAQRLQVLVPPGGAHVPIKLQHGGRLRVQVRDQRGVHLAGTLTLTGPDGAAQKPGFTDADGYYWSDGKLRGNGPVVANDRFMPGAWQVTLDLGARGVHRRTIEVRACEIAEVDVTVQ